MNRGYLLSYYPGTETQYNYLLSLTDWKVSDDTYQLFCHILASSLIQARERNGIIPVSSTLIRKHLPKANWKKLREEGLIRVWEGDRKTKQSNEYAVIIFVVEGFLSRSLLYDAPSKESVSIYKQSKKVNIFTGKAISKPQTSMLYDENRNPVPQLVKNAIQTFKTSFYNEEAVIEYLSNLKTEIEKAPDENTEQRLQAKFRNDSLCFQAVLNQFPTESQWKSIKQYPIPYKAQSFGRITFIQGGFQSCSRKMKQAAYFNIPKVTNYDIKSCHAYILLQLFEEAQIPSEWLKSYLSDPNSKSSYAKKSGLTEDTWKSCFYAVLMGGIVTSTAYVTAQTSVQKYIEDEIIESYSYVDSEAYQAAISAFHTLVLPFKEDLDRLLDYLETQWVSKSGYRAHGGKVFIKNQTGLSLCWSELKTRPKQVRRSRFLAFILQGYEACFIHNLTLLGEKYHFIPISNEHDGLITIGTIPEEAVEEAKAKSGFKYCQLEIKDFV